ncbi:MAG: GNAT family N-acetyltransferase [Candidatus Yonathbacteria bacterium]|nr:GNAT family N-acetyltransferase [Candidatus Yonathbacteria bacterium]
MDNTTCEICAFENPKPTATAIIIKNNEILVAKRNQYPFRGEWDFVGGYMEKEETPEQALRRELKEELHVDVRSMAYIGAFTGTDSYKGQKFPIISFAYLIELEGDMILNHENSDIAWVSLKSLDTIAFDSNQKILKHLKEKFVYDLGVVRALVAQLDSTAIVNEQSLYQAMLEGYVSTVYDGGVLVGMGWIFPRQTMLRRQAVVEDMIVDPSQRGKGLGEKILHDLLRWAKAQGVETVELTTNPKRVAANSLYQKVGFQLHVTNHYLLNLQSYPTP